MSKQVPNSSDQDSGLEPGKTTHPNAASTTATSSANTTTSTTFEQPPQHSHLDQGSDSPSTQTPTQQSSTTTAIIHPPAASAFTIIQLRQRLGFPDASDHKLIRVLEMARNDLERAVDIYYLWARMGAPPLDTEEEAVEMDRKDKEETDAGPWNSPSWNQG